MEDPHGRTADVPESIPVHGLRDVAWRVYHEVTTDHVMLIAAGVTFYLLLATFPALAALVSLYGLVADPATMADHLNILATLLPPGSFEIVADQVASLAATRERTLGITFFVSLGIALWSTRNGVLAIFDAMNIAYEEEEKRGFKGHDDWRATPDGCARRLCRRHARQKAQGKSRPGSRGYGHLHRPTKGD